MAIPTLQESAAVGLVGLGVVQVADLYSKTCGGNIQLRELPPSSPYGKQMVMDADYMVGGLTLIIAGSLAVYTRSWHPVVLFALGFGVVSWYHHSILDSTPVTKDDD